MAGKGAPPLFDLIRSTDHAPPGARPPHAPPEAPTPPPEQNRPPHTAPAPEPKPEPRAETRPEPKPERKGQRGPESRVEPRAESSPEQPHRAPDPDPEPSSRRGKSENASDADSGPRIDFKKRFSIPVSVLYIIVPLILVGAFFAYSWGFSAGERDRDNQLKPYLEPEEVVDPLLAGGGGDAGRSGADAGTPAAGVARPATQDQPGQGARRPAGSPVTRDTRQADHNYLLIARMDGERAIKAAMALTERGLPAIAVESGSRRSNNAWRLYSLLGIPSEKFRQEWQLRADHKARLEAACRDLGDDAGGPIDASTAYWEKWAP